MSIIVANSILSGKPPRPGNRSVRFSGNTDETKIITNDSSYKNYNDNTKSSYEDEDDVHIVNTSTTPGAASRNEIIAYKDPKDRISVDRSLPPSSISHPNCQDILKRVSVVMHQHCVKCEARFAKATPETLETGLFHFSKIQIFSENNFVSPQYCYHFVRTSLVLIGIGNIAIRKVTKKYVTPTVNEIYVFIRDLFVKANLSAECSIVCLIYCERLMETANVPLMAETWKPCLLCGLLLASKVWQDLSSWNIEISQIYPQFTLPSINRLERLFCSEIKWDLYISSSQYAKYYFALRALTEKNDFRRNYNIMMTAAPGAQLVQERSGDMKENFLATTLSKSL